MLSFVAFGGDSEMIDEHVAVHLDDVGTFLTEFAGTKALDSDFCVCRESL